MVRDYCEEIESAILDCINANENGDNIDISEYDSHVVSYLEDSDSYAYYWQNANINNRYRGAIHSNARIQVQESFSAVREYAQSMSTQISEDGSYAGNGYLDVILGLKDLITVSACDKGTDNIAAINSTNDNMNHYDALQGFESSIFGDSASFQSEVESCGSGILYDAYNYLNPEANGWDHFDELMAKNPDDVKLWEYAALSMIVDSYMEQDEDGIVTINYSGMEQFMEHCYSLSSFSSADWHTNYEKPSYTVFELSPVATAFAAYRSQYTQGLLATYGSYIYQYSADSPQVSFVVAECQLNDLITGMALYGQTITEYDTQHYRYTEPTMDISIDPMSEGSRDLTVSIFGQREINIFSLSNNLTDEYNAACQNADAHGYKNPEVELLGAIVQTATDKVIGAAAGAVPVIGPGLAVAYEGFTTLVGWNSAYSAAVEENALRDQMMFQVGNMQYLSSLHVSGSVIQCDGNITINNTMYNTNRLTVDVAYYNANNGTNPDVTVTQLENEYAAYLAGGDDGNLSSFSVDEIGSDYDQYCDAIDDELGRIRDEEIANGENVSASVSIQTATTAELQEAIANVGQ